MLRIVTSFLITGQCKLNQDWKNNLNELTQFFNNNYVLSYAANSLITLDFSKSTSGEFGCYGFSVESRSRTSSYEPCFNLQITIPPDTTGASLHQGKPNTPEHIQLSISSSSSSLYVHQDYVRRSSLGSINEQSLPEALQLVRGNSFPFNTPEHERPDDIDDHPHLTNEPPIKTHTDLGLYGGALMNGMEIMPSVEYLINKVTPIGYLTKDWYITAAIAPYKHYFYSSLHAAGNILYTMFYESSDPIASVASSLTFFAKPQIYAYRDQLLSNVGQNVNGWTKFSVYVVTDTLTSLLIASPFIAVATFPSIGYFTAKGIMDGSINYYNSVIKQEDSIFGNVLALGATAKATILCSAIVVTKDNFIDQIIAIESCIPAIAAIHFYSKFAGDIISDGAQNIYLASFCIFLLLFRHKSLVYDWHKLY
jgi:hypothetical protein